MHGIWQHYRRVRSFLRYAPGGAHDGLDGDFVHCCGGRGWRRRDRPSDRYDRGGTGHRGLAVLARLPAPGPQDHLGQQHRRIRRPQVQAAAVGRGAAHAVHRDAHLRAVRLHLGRQPAHRQRPRPRAAGQPSALLHPGRPVPAVRRGLRSDRAAVRETGPVRGSDHQELVRAGQWFPDGRLWPVRVDRLPARRRLAPHLRPGRHAVGADPPDDDRRRRILDDLGVASRLRG